jgi:DNA-binding transcriptional LysR family regulator
MMNLETEYLNYFKQIAETENMSKAARQLCISQPSLSRTLKNLESEFGCPLFIRKGKSLQLNAAGKILLDYTNKILPLLNQANSEIQALSDATQYIKLSMLYSNKVFPTLLAQFSKSYPKILINLSRYENDDITNSDNDILIHVSDKVAASYPSYKLADEECLIGVSAQHPFASMNEIPLELLSNERFIVLNKKNLLGGTTIHFFNDVGISPPIAMECDNQSSIDSFVALNLGIAVFPSLTWAPINEKIVYKKIKDYHIVRTIYITSISAHNSDATKVFIKFAMEYMQKNYSIQRSEILLNKK